MNPLAPAIKHVWRIKSGIVWLLLLLVVGAFDLAGLLRPDRFLPLQPVD